MPRPNPPVKARSKDEYFGGKPGPGRPKGVPNKVTQEAKLVIAEAAQKLGGVERMVAWAQESSTNERAFWSQIYPKLIPVTVAGDANNPLRSVTLVELIAPRLQREVETVDVYLSGPSESPN
jgi:hypothetical protein